MINNTGKNDFKKQTQYLHMLTDKVRYFLGKTTCIIDWTWWHLVGAQHTIRDGDTVIVFTKSGSLMYDACAVRIRHIGIGEYTECLVFELCSQR